MDWSVLVSIGSALVSIGVAAGTTVAKGPSTSARDTALPPPPPPAPGVGQAEFEALCRRVEEAEARLAGLEGREREAAQAAGQFRTRVLVGLARIGERLGVKEPHAGGPRESDG